MPEEPRPEPPETSDIEWISIPCLILYLANTYSQSSKTYHKKSLIYIHACISGEIWGSLGIQSNIFIIQKYLI